MDAFGGGGFLIPNPRNLNNSVNTVDVPKHHVFKDDLPREPVFPYMSRSRDSFKFCGKTVGSFFDEQLRAVGRLLLDRQSHWSGILSHFDRTAMYK